MRALLVTVAGTSSRFGKSLGRECLKCIYSQNDFSESLLYKLLHKPVNFDKYIIVGGYKFDELKAAVDKNFSDIKDKIVLLENKHYEDYASGYSLYVGLQYVIENGIDEVVFAEGDLFVDDMGFTAVADSVKDVVTYNRETIDAGKAVVFYYDASNNLHYLYDTAHRYLSIDEPFLSVYNSGQIWKFVDKKRVRTCFDAIPEYEWRGTNLVFIQKYFGLRNKAEYELVEFKEWINCNTVQDFGKTLEEK